MTGTIALITGLATGLTGIIAGLAGLLRSRSDARKANVEAAKTLNEMALALVKHWETRAISAETRLRELEIKVAVLTEQIDHMKGIT